MDLSPFLTPTRGPEIISIPLEKYSHSSSAPTSPNHQWTHESKRDGLFLVFQNIPVVSLEELEQHFMMSISLGGNILVRSLKILPMYQIFSLFYLIYVWKIGTARYWSTCRYDKKI